MILDTLEDWMMRLQGYDESQRRIAVRERNTLPPSVRVLSWVWYLGALVGTVAQVALLGWSLWVSGLAIWSEPGRDTVVYGAVRVGGVIVVCLFVTAVWMACLFGLSALAGRGEKATPSTPYDELEWSAGLRGIGAAPP